MDNLKATAHRLGIARKALKSIANYHGYEFEHDLEVSMRMIAEQALRDMEVEVDKGNKQGKLNELLDSDEFKPWKVALLEYESGWGSRIDDVKSFATKAEAEEFVTKFNANNTETVVPDWYIVAECPVFCEETSKARNRKISEIKGLTK